MVEIQTYRYRGQSDPAKYRTVAESTSARGTRFASVVSSRSR